MLAASDLMWNRQQNKSQCVFVGGAWVTSVWAALMCENTGRQVVSICSSDQVDGGLLGLWRGSFVADEGGAAVPTRRYRGNNQPCRVFALDPYWSSVSSSLLRYNNNFKVQFIEPRPMSTPLLQFICCNSSTKRGS